MRNNRRADAIIDPVRVPTSVIMLVIFDSDRRRKIFRLVNCGQPAFVPAAGRALTLERVIRTG
jgi:hypothetical protein